MHVYRSDSAVSLLTPTISLDSVIWVLSYLFFPEFLAQCRDGIHEMVLDKLVQVHGTVRYHGEILVQDGCCTEVLYPGESFCWHLGAPLLEKGWVTAAGGL